MKRDCTLVEDYPLYTVNDRVRQNQLVIGSRNYFSNQALLEMVVLFARHQVYA
ncbi:MAG: hypothetical protein RMX96_15870 [Nostoc sp. ChiSLP02]|nr:hypothetical protein [Nostoc sp. DedSLP05]MDZ8098543.1 hypothetical protein [Nostoc sp. DedSLP01]MDZ8186316.1 hypothetical protein [Nostoc sp. ChiSLP02]